jgi:F420-dependent oxidoreductase-like protein
VPSADEAARVSLRIFTEPQQGASYQELLAAALTAEECGFEAFFRSDHYLKMGDASGLPAYTDAWTTLAGLARDTTSIRLGTLVTPVTFRPIGTFPVVVAQVDHMSGGRVELGLGAGWYETEHRDYGLAFPPVTARFDLLEDQLAILHGLWSTEPGHVFEHQGHTCSVRLEAGPLRPAQLPHPPIIMGGGGGPRSSRLVATYADEFNAPFVPPEKMRDAFAAVRKACEGTGRDPGLLTWSTAQTVCCGRTPDELARRAGPTGQTVDQLRQGALAGTPAEVVEKIGVFARSGAQRVYLQVMDVTDLEHIRLLADEVMPYVSR